MRFKILSKAFFGYIKTSTVGVLDQHEMTSTEFLCDKNGVKKFRASNTTIILVKKELEIKACLHGTTCVANHGYVVVGETKLLVWTAIQFISKSVAAIALARTAICNPCK